MGDCSRRKAREQSILKEIRSPSAVASAQTKYSTRGFSLSSTRLMVQFKTHHVPYPRQVSQVLKLEITSLQVLKSLKCSLHFQRASLNVTIKYTYGTHICQDTP